MVNSTPPHLDTPKLEVPMILSGEIVASDRVGVLLILADGDDASLILPLAV